MDAINKLIEGKIDFRGQSLSNRYHQEGFVLGAILALLVGYVVSSLSVALYIFGAIFALVLVLCVPPWPFYNQYDTLWLPSRTDDEDEKKTKSQ